MTKAELEKAFLELSQREKVLRIAIAQAYHILSPEHAVYRAPEQTQSETTIFLQMAKLLFQVTDGKQISKEEAERLSIWVREFYGGGDRNAAS